MFSKILYDAYILIFETWLGSRGDKIKGAAPGRVVNLAPRAADREAPTTGKQAWYYSMAMVQMQSFHQVHSTPK